MIVVHHLVDSRSHRILWLLEELGVPYEVKHYTRTKTREAAPELLEIHPLGKSPIITDGDRTLHESGAIIDYIVRRHGGGRLQPAPESDDYDTYVEWLHYAEGSVFGALALKMYANRVGDGFEVLRPRMEREIARHLGFLNDNLAKRDWLLASGFSAADVQMSFEGEFARSLASLEAYPAVTAWLDRCDARPAYQAALARGGPYRFAKQGAAQ